MHTDLSPHLHTDECNKIIKALFDCRKEFTFRKFVGKCDSHYMAMLRCTKQERLARRDTNTATAKTKNAELREKVSKDTTDFDELIGAYNRQKTHQQ